MGVQQIVVNVVSKMTAIVASSKHFRFRSVTVTMLTLLVLLLSSVCYVNAAFSTLSLQGEKIYGDKCGNYAIQTSDGGYAIAATGADYDGFNGYDGDGNFGMFIKTNSDGSIQWEKRFAYDPEFFVIHGPYDSTNSSRGTLTEDANGAYITIDDPPILNSDCRFVFETADGGYVVVGTETWVVKYELDGIISNSAERIVFFLAKIDFEGNLIWKQTYEPFHRLQAFTLNSLLATQTSDGGYALAGIYHDEYPCVVKVDAMGNLQWNTALDIEHSYYTDSKSWFSVTEESDGGLLLAGQINFLPRLFKLDPNGNVQWSRTYNMSGSTFSDFVKTSDEGYLWIGRKEVQGSHVGYVVKTDLQGAILWNKTHPVCRGLESFVQDPDEGYETSDGGYVLTGYDFEENGTRSAHLIKINAVGNLEWNKAYGNYTIWVHHLFMTNDGGLVLVGKYGEGLQRWGDRTGRFYRSWVWFAKTAPGSAVSGFLTDVVTISILSPQNQTYTKNSLSVTYDITGDASWIGYSLDGQNNITLTKYTVNLTELPNGSHTLTIYANGTYPNPETSKTINFTINKEPDQFNIILIGALILIPIAAGLGILIHRNKRKHSS
jgi:hypothetical protein